MKILKHSENNCEPATDWNKCEHCHIYLKNKNKIL